MHPIHDVDALLLLALALASKRRPADLTEIIAAADLIHGSIPPESKLGDAFRRLSAHGLIAEAEGRFTLTPDAQKIVAGQPKKADTAERIFGIKGKLSEYDSKGDCAPVLLTAVQFEAAVAAHRAAGQTAGKNMLMPKPKTAEIDPRRAAHWRRPGPSRGRRS